MSLSYRWRGRISPLWCHTRHWYLVRSFFFVASSISCFNANGNRMGMSRIRCNRSFNRWNECIRLCCNELCTKRINFKLAPIDISYQELWKQEYNQPTSPSTRWCKWAGSSKRCDLHQRHCDLPDLRQVLAGSVGHLDGVVQGDHVRLAVDPQHRGGDVLSQVALQAETPRGSLHATGKLEAKRLVCCRADRAEPELLHSGRESRRRDYRRIRSGFSFGARLLT